MITKEALKYQKFINEFNKCAEACYECVNACLAAQDISSRKNCIKLLLECAKMCETTAFIMSMDGKFVKRQSALCAEVCDVCSQECALLKEEHCQKCAQECRHCADACKEMLEKT